MVLAGTWGYMGSATRVPQLPLTPLCFDALQSPAEPSGLEPTAPPRRVSLGSLCPTPVLLPGPCPAPRGAVSRA